ncbi:MAG: alginate export family protein [Kiritimatiellae bacterium]|nr:alginate export family protein [Kiritimatiellia bacterium]
MSRAGIAWAVVVAALVFGGGMAWAQADAGNDAVKFGFGGDVRFRLVEFDEIPIIADPPGVTRSGKNTFFRFRTRVWGQVDMLETLTLKGRLVHEFRGWDSPDMSGTPTSSNWGDGDPLEEEIVVDQLYIEARDLLGKDSVDIRVGRQDLIYGTGKVILEGTPKDGSRTIYLDAVKATLRMIPDTTVDLLGMYTQSKNMLAINEVDNRDLTGYNKYDNDGVESGAGIYAKNASCKRMPAEAYYLYKNEGEWDSFDSTGAAVEVPENTIHTIGIRLMPKLSDSMSANAEAAYQTGETGDETQNGYMLDATLKLALPMAEKNKPTVGVGCYVLSGDDPDSAEDEGWNPIWARWPQYSELYIYSWDAEKAGRWTNLMMPHIDASVALNPKLRIEAMLAWLNAMEKDGPGGGSERGLLGTVRADFTLAQELLGKKDKLFGHLALEMLNPGDYYNVDDASYFARGELSYSF